MKKLKELLVFVIPFVLLSVLSVIYFALHTQNSGFMGGIQYVRLLWKDELFCKAFINTYMKPLAFSCLFVMVFTIIYYLIKHKVMIPMPVYRLCSMVIGSAVAFPLIIFGSLSFVGFLVPNCFHILGVGQNNIAGGFQNVVDGSPILPGGFYTHILAVVL